VDKDDRFCWCKVLVAHVGIADAAGPEMAPEEALDGVVIAGLRQLAFNYFL
jgi:hypothetical protein